MPRLLMSGSGTGRRGAASLLLSATVMICVLLALVGAASTASAAEENTTTYTATETFPVPPASSFAGSGGGDGWAVALSKEQVYNVFHHSAVLTVACHKQSDASACYSPITVTDAKSNNFATSGHPGMFLDQKTGKLYVYATRSSDGTAGVVCFDTGLALKAENPFCGFTELTPVGQGPIDPSEISGLSVPMLIGTHWYSFNFVTGVNVSGAENELLCFDVSTDAACKSQPFAVTIGEGNVEGEGFPSPATAAIGSQVIIPINIGEKHKLACFDDGKQGNCAGSWPVELSFNYPEENGSPFPLLDSSGKLTGLCLPTGTDQCFTLEGATATTPKEMPSVIAASDPWNGPALVLGPRIYVPNGTANSFSGDVQCFDYSTGKGCANFPKTFSNLGYLYTVNADPQRPTCIWVNADSGSAQIQDFDAYTGGACGEGAIRVLASQFVVPKEKCKPTSYVSLQLLRPGRSVYASGQVSFADGAGNPIPGAEPRPLDETGTADLKGLELNTATGLPQFIIELKELKEKVGEVEVKLTWIAKYDPECSGPKTKVTPQPTTLTTTLSGGGKLGESLTVPEGTAVSDKGTLSGKDAAGASGKVAYKIYSDKECTKEVTSAGEVTVSGGAVPASEAKTLSPGTYYWQASYGGDEGNEKSVSRCGAEVLTVESKAAVPCGKTTIGKVVDQLVANRKRVNPACVLFASTTVTELVTYLTPTSHSGSQLIKGIVYADNKGKPGALVGVTQQLTFKSTNAAGWYHLAFSPALKLSAGEYWMGIITGASTGVAAEAYDTVPNAEDINTNSYASGPSKSFGSFKKTNEQMSLYLTLSNTPG
jgi:hypothetical protein